MNNIQYLASNSTDIRDFTVGYLEYMNSILKRISIDSIAAFISELEAAYKEGKKIFIIGNGGSASTASHMANDIRCIHEKSEIEKPFRPMSLTDNISYITAIANDDCYNNTFVKQLEIYYDTGDLLVAISASGNSPNIISAAEWTKEHGGKVIGLVGFNGGKLREISDIDILVETPTGEYGPVEDVHLIINHLVTTWFQFKPIQAI